jgi:hypothetical protein
LSIFILFLFSLLKRGAKLNITGLTSPQLYLYVDKLYIYCYH